MSQSKSASQENEQKQGEGESREGQKTLFKQLINNLGIKK